MTVFVKLMLIVMFWSTGCAYTAKFGGEEKPKDPLTKKSDIDAVLDKELIYPKGYKLKKEGLHWW
jgi:hypothetical protein